ncbi:MAG: hypothetical protein LBH31_07645 [Burkholderiaceae bacterium]|nr:hypothetical protein [Burkholderiaceae bacterium]
MGGIEIKTKIKLPNLAVDMPNPIHPDPATFTNNKTDCPNPYAANGVAFSASVSFVVGAGYSDSVTRLGGLVSYSYPHSMGDLSYGLDVGAGVGIGASAVLSVQEEKCGC